MALQLLRSNCAPNPSPALTLTLTLSLALTRRSSCSAPSITCSRGGSTRQSRWLGLGFYTAEQVARVRARASVRVRASPSYLPSISPISPPYLPCISQVVHIRAPLLKLLDGRGDKASSPLYLPYISPVSPPYLPCSSCSMAAATR